MEPTPRTEDFSKLRSWLFPVHKTELRLLIPMGLMMVLTSFNFWILHISKDTLVITAEHSGAEVISFLKLPVFIVSIFFVMGFTWISNLVHQKAIFYGIVGFFLCYIFLFTFFLYPAQDALNLFSAPEISRLMKTYPYFRWVFPVIGYWSHSLFYIIAELWGAVVLSMLFWQFANQITTVEQSRRFYMLLGIFNGIGTIASGLFVAHYEKVLEAPAANLYGAKLQDLLFACMAGCAGIIWLYSWINKHVANTDYFYDPKTGRPEYKDEIKLSFLDSFRYILSSRYVGYIAVISIAYNIAINCVEVTWKSQIKALYHDPLSMERYFAEVTTYMGWITCAIAFFGTGFIRKFSWKSSSLLTPYVMLVMTILFFVPILWADHIDSLSLFFAMTPLTLSVWLGQAHNLFSKSCKYSFFAATREMAFVPLDAELKVKGKAAVDILSGRIGKFGGAFIQSLLLSLPYLGSQLLIAPYLLGICLLVFVLWIFSVNALNKDFLKVAYGKAPRP